ncbi:unnamed protein product, partial [Symbiodinium sp. KB8]
MDLLAIQEAPRGESGWSEENTDGFTWLLHRSCDQWRGVGIGISNDLYDCHTDRTSCSRGAAWVVRLKNAKRFILGSLHCPTGVTVAVYYKAVQEFRKMLQAWHSDLPCFVGVDVNESIVWNCEEEEGLGVVGIRGGGKIDKFLEDVGGEITEHLQTKVHVPGLQWDAKLRSVVQGISCKDCDFQPVRIEEIASALAGMKSRSSLGPDLIGVDLLRKLVDVAPDELCALYSEVLATGEIPDDWGVSFLALLPKVRCPTCPGELRPIAMSSAAFKVMSRVVINRSFRHLRQPCPWSTSGSGRSCADLVGCIGRVRDMTREWRLGMVIIKLDIRGAFDCLDRMAVVRYVQRHLQGCQMPFEERFLLKLLAENQLIGSAPGGAKVAIRANRGIRQGSPESAELFGMIVSEIITDLKTNGMWKMPAGELSDMPADIGSYQDDIVLWGDNVGIMSKNIKALADRLRGVGLQLATNKTKIIASKYYKGTRTVMIDGEKVDIQPLGTSLRVVGVDFDLDATPGQQAKELMRRVWAAFHENKKVLCGPGSFHQKFHLVQMLLEGVWAWIAGAVHWDDDDLQAMNGLQLRVLRLCFGWKRLRDEDWVAYNSRSIRGVRLWLSNAGLERWSSKILRLQHQWNSQPQNWGPETWSGPANYYNDNYHEDSVNHGDQAAHTGNLGAGQWDDSYSWQQQQWWDAPSSWVQTGWTAGYWDGYAWNTPSWTTPVSSSTSSWTAPSSSSSTRRDDRNGHASSSSPSWTVPSSSRSSTRWDDSSGYGRHAPSMAANVDSEQDSPPPWDDPRAQDSHRRDEREPRDARRDRGDRRDRGWLRPDEERPVGFYRLGVFVPRRRNDYEERFHRGGAGDVRLGRKEARARAWREGTFRPASFWQGMATGSQPSGDGMNFAEALNRHLIPRDHDYEYGVDWQGDGPPVLPHWAIPGMWTSSSVPSSTSSTSPSSTSSTSPSLSSSTTSTTCPCNCQPAEPLGTVDSTSGGGSPEAETNTDENEETVNLMQQPPPGCGTGPGANNNVDGAGPARLSFHLSEEEIRGFLEAVWPQAVIDNVVEFCNYLEDVAVQYGMEAVAWSGSAWIDSLTVANATVELVQETLFRRLRGVQEARPTVNATRGRLMVGWAGFQRVVSDFHQGLVAEGLREHWLPSRIDADGRRVEDPPFVRGTRGDHDLWAQVRARELARALVEQGRRDGLLRRTGGDGATSSLGGASSSDMVQHQGLRDERGPTTTGGTMDGGAVEEGGIVDGGADDTEEQDGEDDIDEGGLMQVSLEEEERLHRHNVQNEARRHLRTLLLSLEHIQQRGEGPEYRWGVQVLLRAYGMAEEVVGVFREILQRRVSGGQPYFPIVREPPIGALRSRVLSWMGEFRFMLTRALSEELLLQMQELGRVPQVAGGDGSVLQLGLVAVPHDEKVQLGVEPVLWTWTWTPGTLTMQTVEQDLHGHVLHRLWNVRGWSCLRDQLHGLVVEMKLLLFYLQAMENLHAEVLYFLFVLLVLFIGMDMQLFALQLNRMMRILLCYQLGVLQLPLHCLLLAMIQMFVLNLLHLVFLLNLLLLLKFVAFLESLDISTDDIRMLFTLIDADNRLPQAQGRAQKFCQDQQGRPDRFVGVTEENINSIFRRTAVCAYKSTFVDAVRISGREELAASHGIFPRDPTLKDFLREKPACLVTLRCIWNYARSRTAEQCRDVLEKCVVRGGDGGLTLATVRRSCGLTPNENAQVDSVQEALDALINKPAGPSLATAAPAKDQASMVKATVDGHKAEQNEALRQIRQWLRDERKDWMSVLWHYRVQVNIYAWILRKYYDINVTELRIVCLHPNNAPQPLIVNVPMMQDKIEKLMSWRRDDRHSQIHLSADARDLRGGSQEGGPSFSQMLEMEMDTYEFMQTDFDMSSVPGQSSDRESAEGSILKEIGELDRTIAAYGPSASWSTTFRHVPQGTVAVHQLRLLDISRREEVLFLELIEGSGRHVRAPDGQWFFSSEHGHWNAYKGVIPQGILQASQDSLERSHREEADKAEERGNASVHWTVVMANTNGKLYVKLQTSLLNDSLIKYYVEWCSLNMQPSGGFCTTDASFVFTDDGLQAVPKTASNNVYVYLPRRMPDPVADDVKERVHRFWKTTYWGNADAFEVFMASFTLALRGENVDGVGQSLQTVHLEAILGEYHTCLDMNIYSLST